MASRWFALQENFEILDVVRQRPSRTGSGQESLVIELLLCLFFFIRKNQLHPPAKQPSLAAGCHAPGHKTWQSTALMTTSGLFIGNASSD